MATSKRPRANRAERQSRQNAITDYLVVEGPHSVEDIAAFADISLMTAYRDLEELEAQGLLRRARGLVTAAATQEHEASSRYRLTQNLDAKEQLAQAALEFIEPGSAIMMDDSSTGVALAKLLPDRAPLTVVTTYHPVAHELADAEDIRLIMTGGQYHAWAEALMGPMAVAAIRGMHADVAIMSASAIKDGRCLHPTEEPAEVKRAMLSSATTRILYVDASKFTRTALHVVAPVTDFSLIIVDAGTAQADIEDLERCGVRVVRASV